MPMGGKLKNNGLIMLGSVRKKKYKKEDETVCRIGEEQVRERDRKRRGGKEGREGEGERGIKAFLPRPHQPDLASVGGDDRLVLMDFTHF